MKNGNVMLRTIIATTMALASIVPRPVIADDKLSSAAAVQPPPPNTGEPWFVECAAARGLQFQHVSGHQQRHLMPEIMGGGAALFDMDNDGDLDALLVQSGSLIDPQAMSSHRLFRNRGDGFFDDITQASTLPRGPGYGMGVTSGDYDNDGDVDLYVTAYGPNMLLRNDGPTDVGHRFTDVTTAASVGHDGWSSSAAFLDFDRDGDLDLFVANYLNWSPATEIDCHNDMGGPDYCSPKNYNAPALSVLYRNNGDGTFSDISQSSGIASKAGTGLGVACADFNSDGWLDIFVANDGMPNHLWMNQGDGTFMESAGALGCAVDQDGIAKAGMGVTATDIDDDGDLDLLVGNLNRESDSLFRNDGGWFSDRTALAGLAVVSRPFTRFGLGWFDFNNDGLLDLFQANGRVMRQSQRYSDDPFAEPNLLMRGVGRGRFQEVKPRGGTEPMLIATSRAAAFGDIDNDGGVDVLIVNRDGPAHLLRNVAAGAADARSERWIGFRVIDEHGRDALHAIVTAKFGDRTIMRSARTDSSYMAANDPRVHIGLGREQAVRDVTVTWPDGTAEHFGDRPAGGYHELRRGRGAAAK